jgi:hypothetical protein
MFPVNSGFNYHYIPWLHYLGGFVNRFEGKLGRAGIVIGGIGVLAIGEIDCSPREGN